MGLLELIICDDAHFVNVLKSLSSAAISLVLVLSWVHLWLVLWFLQQTLLNILWIRYCSWLIIFNFYQSH